MENGLHNLPNEVVEIRDGIEMIYWPEDTEKIRAYPDWMLRLDHFQLKDILSEFKISKRPVVVEIEDNKWRVIDASSGITSLSPNLQEYDDPFIVKKTDDQFNPYKRIVGQKEEAYPGFYAAVGSAFNFDGSYFTRPLTKELDLGEDYRITDEQINNLTHVDLSMLVSLLRGTWLELSEFNALGNYAYRPLKSAFTGTILKGTSGDYYFKEAHADGRLNQIWNSQMSPQETKILSAAREFARNQILDYSHVIRILSV